MMPQQKITRPQMREVFGFQVPSENYYLHKGHAWVLPEGDDRVRVGLDDFSQKLLGPAEWVKLPEIGKAYHQDHLCMALFRQGHKASFEAPVDGVIEVTNPKIEKNPGLMHDDPYGEGWLFVVKHSNLKRNLENLVSGEDAVIWIEEETHRLLNLLDSRLGVALPDGGVIVDDVIGNYQELGWRPLVHAFFLKHLTSKGFIPQVKLKKEA
jgi:glycine cleavage system H lipoate-binding protein